MFSSIYHLHLVTNIRRDNHCMGSSYFSHIQSVCCFITCHPHFFSFTWIFLLFIAVLVFLPLLRLLLHHRNRRQQVKEFSLPINLLDSFTHMLFFPRGWLNEDVKCWIFFFFLFSLLKKCNLVPAAPAPCTQLPVCSQELPYDPKYPFNPFFPPT